MEKSFLGGGAGGLRGSEYCLFVRAHPSQSVDTLYNYTYLSYGLHYSTLTCCYSASRHQLVCMNLKYANLGRLHRR